MELTTALLIDGAWCAADETFSSLDPSTGEPIGSVAAACAADVDAAVGAARKALPAWSALGVAGRCEQLARAVAALREAYGEEGAETPLKALITREVGKPLPEADVELAETADVLEYFVTNAETLLADETLTLDTELWPTKRSTVVHRPVGVVAAIKPWNYPLELPIWSIAPALVAGNAVVFKPSEHAPLVANALAGVLVSAGLPPGVLNVVHGDGAVGEQLAAHPGVDMVSFTGSQAAGRAVAHACAEQLRRCTLELGGVDPALVLADADPELAANGLTWGAFANAGQVCVRPKRMLVEAAVHDRFVEDCLARAAALRKGVDYGPLISEAQRRRVHEQVEEAGALGASVLCGGAPDEGPGFHYPPTIVVGVTPQMRLWNEECFGPVMAVSAVADEQDAVRLANASPYGLGASVWSADQAAGERLARRLDVGMAWVNDVNVAFPQAPWGGVKRSGLGVELGRWGLDEYTVKQHVSVETSHEVRREWWFPYA